MFIIQNQLSTGEVGKINQVIKKKTTKYGKQADHYSSYFNKIHEQFPLSWQAVRN